MRARFSSAQDCGLDSNRQKLFLGCYGLSRFGMTETDPLIVQAQVKLIKRAEELVVMADSRKFSQRSSMVVAPLERISTIITDDGASSEDLEPFRIAGIKVIVAKVRDEEEAPKTDSTRRP
jgi:DeoR family ulaG and ulaABCDEF operon transcriptional repressor